MPLISFIIIGRNIQNTIALCIESVFKFVKSNEIAASEILYVDSNSNDNSLKIAQQYPIRIVLITGTVNAAIARNAGAMYSKGTVLFFVDGDMELIPDFYKLAFDIRRSRMKYPFVSGYLRHRYYSGNFRYLYSEDDKIPEKPMHMNFTRGLMIIERALWDRIDGMDERLVRNQDMDFGLRMAEIGIPVKLYSHLMAIHHTVSYFDKSRFSSFFRTTSLFSPGLLMRKHIFSRAYLNRYLRNVFYVFILFSSFLLLPYKPEIGLLFLFIYTLIQLARTVKNIRSKEPLFRSFLFKTLYNFYSMVGFFFYFPKKFSYHSAELKNTAKRQNHS